MLFPLLGAAFLWYTKSNIGHRALKKRVEDVIKAVGKIVDYYKK